MPLHAAESDPTCQNLNGWMGDLQVRLICEYVCVGSHQEEGSLNSPNPSAPGGTAGQAAGQGEAIR